MQHAAQNLELPIIYLFSIYVEVHVCQCECSSEDMRVLYFHVVCSRGVNSGSQSRKRSVPLSTKPSHPPQFPLCTTALGTAVLRTPCLPLKKLSTWFSKSTVVVFVLFCFNYFHFFHFFLFKVPGINTQPG